MYVSTSATFSNKLFPLTSMFTDNVCKSHSQKCKPTLLDVASSMQRNPDMTCFSVGECKLFYASNLRNSGIIPRVMTNVHLSQYQ